MSDTKITSFRNFSFDGFKIPVITVYYNPIEYPNKYVARLFNMDIPTKYVAIADTIDEIREKIPQGLIKFGKDVNDNVAVVETWL